jgi:hypothetical protein
MKLFGYNPSSRHLQPLVRLFGMGSVALVLALAGCAGQPHDVDVGNTPLALLRQRLPKTALEAGANMPEVFVSAEAGEPRVVRQGTLLGKRVAAGVGEATATVFSLATLVPAMIFWPLIPVTLIAAEAAGVAHEAGKNSVGDVPFKRAYPVNTHNMRIIPLGG